MLCGLSIFFASCASSAYLFANAISAFNSLHVSSLSLGPITFTTVGVAQETQNINKVKKTILFFIIGINDSKKILFEQIEEVAKKRRGNINELKYDNIKWNEEAMVECYLNMYCGYFGKKLAREAVMVIYWCRQNLTEKEINKIIKKVGLSEEKVFGSLL